MATINGKALVKDGKPLDRVYSNGKLVYGRNLLSGTKDFSGASWVNIALWKSDGTYNGLIVKSTQGNPQGLFQRFTIPKDGDYVFSIYVSATNGLKPTLAIGRNGTTMIYSPLSSSPSNMTRVSYLAKGLKNGDVMTGRIEELSQVGSKISVAGQKWEQLSETPWTPAPEDYI